MEIFNHLFNIISNSLGPINQIAQVSSMLQSMVAAAERVFEFLEEKEEVFIGMGVNPDLCNKHYGQRMLLITYEISKKLYPDKPLYLEVRTWNIRAVKCYQKQDLGLMDKLMS